MGTNEVNGGIGEGRSGEEHADAEVESAGDNEEEEDIDITSKADYGPSLIDMQNSREPVFEKTYCHTS